MRVTFATNDERTAKRISETLGTATELKSQRNYAGHRLAPWLGHLMVSRQETARPLLTPGEVMLALRSANARLAAGELTVRDSVVRIDVGAPLTTAREVGSVVVSARMTGDTVVPAAVTQETPICGERKKESGASDVWLSRSSANQICQSDHTSFRVSSSPVR